MHIAQASSTLCNNQCVICILWGYVVHIRCVSQKHWDVLKCLFPALQPVFTLTSCPPVMNLFISVSAELHTLTVILLMSPENYSSIYPSYCHFSGLLTDTVKGSGSQSSSFLYSYFPQVLTVREQEKEGRGKGPGEERSRPRSASSWYEVENKSLFS